jgi:TRAP transporter TAXI family solute receptor
LHVANGAFPGIRGKNLHDMRDQDGKFTTQDFMRIATTPPYQAWSDFRWRNPKTGSIDEKSAWIERMGEYLIGVGIYKAEQQNLNTVSIISGSPGSDATYLQAAYDLAAVLNDGENLRVLPVVGIGGPQNIRDVRALKGIDVGLTQTSILNSFRRSNAVLGVPDDDKIAIVSKLFNLEAHLVVKAGSGITSIEQLRGQKVNLDEVGSGTNSSMRDVLQRLDVKVEEVNMVQSQALLKLKDGEIAATVLVAGKPADSMSRLTRADGLAFLPIPYSAALTSDFLPAELTHEDYPDMIAEGQSVKTVADSAVLIAYNWQKNTERYHRVEMFVNAFFSKIAEFQKSPHHPKWRRRMRSAHGFKLRLRSRRTTPCSRSSCSGNDLVRLVDQDRKRTRLTGRLTGDVFSSLEMPAPSPGREHRATPWAMPMPRASRFWSVRSPPRGAARQNRRRGRAEDEALRP